MNDVENIENETESILSTKILKSKELYFEIIIDNDF